MVVSKKRVIPISFIFLASFLLLSVFTGRRILDAKSILDKFMGRHFFVVLTSICFCVSVPLLMALLCGLRGYVRVSAVFLAVAIVLEMTIAVSAFGYSLSVEKSLLPHVNDTASKSLDKYFSIEENKEFWDTIQRKGDCCGLGDSSFWQHHIPASCPVRFSRQEVSCVNYLLREIRLTFTICAAQAIVLSVFYFFCCLLPFLWDKTFEKNVSDGLTEVAESITNISVPNFKAVDNYLIG